MGTTKRKKLPSDYPLFMFRPSREVAERIASLKNISGLTKSQIVNLCIKNYLTTMESRHGIGGKTRSDCQP